MDKAGPAANHKADPERNPLKAEGFYQAIESLLNEVMNDIEAIEDMIAPILKEEGTITKEPAPSIPAPETGLERKREEALEKFLRLRSHLKILKSRITL